MKSLLSEILQEVAWLGFVVTAMIGGIVGYLKSYEQANIETTWRVAMWALFRRILMGAFAGFMVYQASVIYSWSSAYTHVASGIVGIFASEFFEVLWIRVKVLMQAINPPK